LLARDEAEALLGIEELHSSCCQRVLSLIHDDEPEWCIATCDCIGSRWSGSRTIIPRRAERTESSPCARPADRVFWQLLGNN
jgi:hypothetical protein